jgi:hypothetical protein
MPPTRALHVQPGVVPLAAEFFIRATATITSAAFFSSDELEVISYMGLDDILLSLHDPPSPRTKVRR